jgi:acetyltransferase-like isoleucine patch superfamily enzyme
MNVIRTVKFFSLKLSSYFYNTLNYFKANFLWRIKIGTNCLFNGNTIFFKNKNSNITIGNNCIFISKTDGLNLIGVNRPCIIATKAANANINIGNNCGFSGSAITSFISIEIGNNVMCGANTFITDSDWHPEDYRSGVPKAVKICNNVWLGLNVVVLKGVIIGENTIVGANSVVTKSLPANVIAAGNPCKIIRELEKK